MEGGKALVHHVMEDWEYLQLQYSLYLQGPSVPGVRRDERWGFGVGKGVGVVWGRDGCGERLEFGVGEWW